MDKWEAFKEFTPKIIDGESVFSDLVMLNQTFEKNNIVAELDNKECECMMLIDNTFRSVYISDDVMEKMNFDYAETCFSIISDKYDTIPSHYPRRVPTEKDKLIVKHAIYYLIHLIEHFKECGKHRFTSWMERFCSKLISEISDDGDEISDEPKMFKK
jgi:hypothetical protein